MKRTAEEQSEESIRLSHSQKSSIRLGQDLEKKARDAKGKWPMIPRERLHALYDQFPNLTFSSDPFSETEDVPIRKLYDLLKDKQEEDLTLPVELKAMLQGEADWDREQVSAFLEKFGAIFEMVDSLGELKPQRMAITEGNLFFDNSFSNVLLNHLMELRQKMAVEDGDMEAAFSIRDNRLALAKHVAPTSGFSILPAWAIERDLYKKGSLPFSSQETTQTVSSTAHIIDALKADFIHNIWAIEAVTKDSDLLRESRPMMEQSQSEVMTASIFSETIARLEALKEGDAMPSINGLLRITKELYPEVPETDEILANSRESIYITFVNSLDLQILRGKFFTENAIAEAQSDGVEVSDLKSLVPKYISELPVHPETLIPYSLDPVTGEIQAPPASKVIKP